MKALSSAGFLIGGLALGIVLGKGPLSSGERGQPDTQAGFVGARGSGSGRAALQGNSGDSRVNEIRQAAPHKVPSLTQRAISMADPVESKRLLAECLLHMTADNWREVIASFNQISITTGRDPANEWKLALFRAGQVAGAEAMEPHLENGFKNGAASWSTLYGWGSKDPRAALAWLKKAESEGRQPSNALYSAILAGAALNSPADALKLLDGIPSAQRQSCAGHLVWNVVQNGGTDALEPLLQYASKLDGSDAGNEKLTRELFHEATEKLLWKADHARDMPQACEVITKLGQYGRDPNEVTRAAIQKFRWYSMPDKLNLLETVSAGPQGSELHLASLTSTILSTMGGGDGDRAAIQAWMKQHPESPLIPHLNARVSTSP